MRQRRKIVHPPLKKLRQANLSCSNCSAASSAALPRVPSTTTPSSSFLEGAASSPSGLPRVPVPKESRLASSPSSVAELPVFQPAPPQKTISMLSPEDRNAALLQSGCARHRGTSIMLNEKQAFLLQCWREEFDTLTMLGNDRIRKFTQLGIKKRRLDAAHTSRLCAFFAQFLEGPWK